MTTAAQYLDGDIPVRFEGVRFDVLDVSLNTLGVLAVDRDRVPTISNDVGRRVRRQITNLTVPPRPMADQSTARYYADDLDTLTMRLRANWLLSTGDEFAQGIYLFGDDSSEVYSYGTPRHVLAVDQCSVLDDALGQNVGYAPGDSISAALAAECDAAGFSSAERFIDATSATFAEPVAWTAGRDTRLIVLESLCALAGFLPPYFDNDGILTCRAAPDLSTSVPDFVYGPNTNVIAGSIVLSNDLLAAPNRYLAIASSSRDVPIVGTFDVPDAAPHSYANTGRRRTKTIDLQGLTDEATAYAAAAAAYAADSETYSWLQFSTPPDPRHDTWDVLSFDGVNYRQLAWSLACAPGAAMRHDCRGTYS